MYWLSFPTGFATSAALIIAIGAQNAFVLRQGIRNEHVMPIVAVCAASDALLITLGVFGLGQLLRQSPLLLEFARYGGAAFLTLYAVHALRRAWSPQSLASAADTSPAGRSLGAVLLTTVGFTFLNPHVYLDTFVLLGSIGGSQPAGGQIPFVLGASCASATWFILLGTAARRLAPLFSTPQTWRLLDSVIAAIMIVLAIGLLVAGAPAA